MSVAAIVGALAVMSLILWVSQKVRDNVTLLIIGVMIGYLATAIIGVLKFLSPEEDVKAFVVWGLGSFSRVSGDEMVLFVVLMCVLLPLACLLVKTMNLLLLGERYAANLGLNIRRSRMLVIYRNGLLWSYHVYWSGCSSSGTSHFPHFRSSHTDASHSSLWRSVGIVLQSDSTHAGLRGRLACKQRYRPCGCSCYCECIIPSSSISRIVRFA